MKEHEGGRKSNELQKRKEMKESTVESHVRTWNIRRTQRRQKKRSERIKKNVNRTSLGLSIGTSIVTFVFRYKDISHKLPYRN